MWLSYRCFAARGEERVPLFGDFGLVNQLGSATYARPRKFRERLERWLDLVRMMWLECPALISRMVERSSSSARMPFGLPGATTFVPKIDNGVPAPLAEVADVDRVFRSDWAVHG